MSNTTDPELCSLLTNVFSYNHPKILTSQKLCSPLGLFDLKSFHELVILLGRIELIYCLPCVLLGYRNEGKFLQKNILNMVVKIFKKYQNVPMGTHKKTNII